MNDTLNDNELANSLKNGLEKYRAEADPDSRKLDLLFESGKIKTWKELMEISTEGQGPL